MVPRLALLALAAACVRGVAAQSDDVGAQVGNVVFIVVLVMLSALFSGLTLGLLGLDTNQLKIVMEAGSVDEKRWAAKIWPIRQNGNLLLCTLLLGNVLVNAQLSILSANLTSGTVGLIASTALIVIFGEIIPQALCSRYALYIGATAVPLVRVIIVLMYVVAKPISLCLDWALGEELGKFYSEREFNSLIEQHAAVISEPRRQIMKGALQITMKTVQDIMTPREDIFSVSSSDKLTFEVMSAIFKSGFSRIPVFDGDSAVVGLLYAKDLMLVVPADEVPVITLVSFFERDVVTTVDATDKIEGCLKSLTSSGGHFAMVRDIDDSDSSRDPVYRIVGCVTLEDVIEEILQMELVDEFDEYTSRGGRRTGRAAYGQETLRLLDTSRGHNDLTPALVRAVAATLQATVPAFSTGGPDGTPMSMASISDLVSGSRVLDLVAPEVASPGGAGEKAGEDAPHDEQGAADAAAGGALYRRGQVYTVCTLVLNGEFDVTSGGDGITSVVRNFELLAPNALTAAPGSYKADFTARLRSGTARVLRISRDEFADAQLFQRPDGAPAPEPPAAGAGGAAASGPSLLRRRTGTDGSTALHVPGANGVDVADKARLQARPGAGSSLTARDPAARRRKRSSEDGQRAAAAAAEPAAAEAVAVDVKEPGAGGDE